CYSGSLENKRRQDVEQTYNKRFHQKVTIRSWSGFTGIFNPQLSDGMYRLGIGKYSEGKFIYRLTNQWISSCNGKLKMIFDSGYKKLETCTKL
ncbi:hypothetical protein V6O07_20980, partial [Arthrospira platensis SPKY2]